VDGPPSAPPPRPRGHLDYLKKEIAERLSETRGPYFRSRIESTLRPMKKPTASEIEAEARKMWDERELSFPPHTRQRWEQGSLLARNHMLMEARIVLVGD